MTLTLLLQLTDDEQLYAQEPTIHEQTTEQPAATAAAPETPVAEWPGAAVG